MRGYSVQTCEYCGKIRTPYWHSGMDYPKCTCTTSAIAGNIVALPAKITLEQSIPIGWQCPACKVIYSPDVKSCLCQGGNNE